MQTMAQTEVQAMPEARPVLLITRPDAAAARFLADLRPACAVPFVAVVSPLIGIAAVLADVPQAGLTAIVVTSENGAERAASLGLPRGMPAFCVGARTAEVVRNGGFVPIVAGGNADALVAMILSRGVRGRLLHLRGAHVRGDVAARLQGPGLRCDEAVVYDQVEQPLSADARAALAGPGPVVAPLFSPRTVSILARNLPFMAPVHVIAISAAVADAAAILRPAQLVTVAHSEADAMRDATAEMLTSLARA